MAQRNKGMEALDELAQPSESAEDRPELPPWRARLDSLLFETPNWAQAERLALLKAFRDLCSVSWNKYRCPHQDCNAKNKRFSNRDDLQRHAEDHHQGNVHRLRADATELSSRPRKNSRNMNAATSLS